MSKRKELDELARAMAEVVLSELSDRQRRFFEQDAAAPIDLDVWIGQVLDRAIKQVVKQAKSYYRKWGVVEVRDSEDMP